MKNILLATVALALSSASAFAGSWVENYNAKLNTPAEKARVLAEVCNPAATTFNGETDASFLNTTRCAKFKKDGVPDADIRHAIIATTALAGAVAGGALVTTPAIIGQSGAFTIFGATPTLIQAAVGGALVGGVVAGVATR